MADIDPPNECKAAFDHPAHPAPPPLLQQYQELRQQYQSEKRQPDVDYQNAQFQNLIYQAANGDTIAAESQRGKQGQPDKIVVLERGVSQDDPERDKEEK